MWKKVDEEIARRLAQKLEESNKKADHDVTPATQNALELHRT
jgi:hypothetical protein